MPPPTQIRIPILENLGHQYGWLFARSRRYLTTAEKEVARPVFLSSVDLDAVQVVETSVINAPTTLGNFIRISPGYEMSNATLIHELAHIWQYQTQGNQYISNSACHQVTGILVHGDRNRAYRYRIVHGKSFYHYTAEQQATIVENFYRNPTLRHNRDYLSLMREVRAARPNLTPLQRYQESLYGHQYLNNYHHEEMLQQQMPEYRRINQLVPLFRIEF